MNKQHLKQPIGIFGGTFDPVHLGHIHIADSVLKQMRFQKIHFIPCFLPPHRRKPTASAHHRLAMLNIATQNRTELIVDDREIQRKGISYMIDTLKSLRKEFQKTPLCLIIGMDAFALLNTWSSWQELIKYCHIIVVNRPEFSSRDIHDEVKNLLQKTETKNSNDLFCSLNGKIYIINTPPTEASATNIRKQLQLQQKPKELSEEVFQYAIKNNIYTQCI